MENEKTESSNENLFEKPVTEAPLIKEKKTLTERQKEILKMGREKLAAKRMAKFVQSEKVAAKVSQAEKTDVETTEVVQPKVKRKCAVKDSNELKAHTKHVKENEPVVKKEEMKEKADETKETKEKSEGLKERVVERPVIIEKNKDEGIIILALIGIIGVMLFLLFKYLKSKENGSDVNLNDTSEEEPTHPNAVTRDGAYPVMNSGSGNIE